MNTAIILAAGSGRRFGAAYPKQFADLLGKPVLVHALERFERCPAIDQIILVLSEEGRTLFDRAVDEFHIAKLAVIVTGGSTRAESVLNGLELIDAATTRIVAVHDGARPLVTVDEITRTVDTAKQTGAACLVCEVNDTIKETEAGSIKRTIDRSTLRRALTPQAFKYEILRRAFDGVELSDSVTDECYLVERLGIPISLVEGSSRNIKITNESDLVLAELLMTAEGRKQSPPFRP